MGRAKVAGFTPGRLYHEAAFRYLLASESHRSQRTGFAHHLLLVYQNAPGGGMAMIPSPVVELVGRVLSHCLRETDYIGWYRDGRVVGGVLTAIGKESGADQIESLRARIVDNLRHELGEKDSGGVQVRICSCEERAGHQREQESYCAVHYQNA